MSMNMRARMRPKVNLSPEHRRRLAKLWMRLHQQPTDTVSGMAFGVQPGGATALGPTAAVTAPTTRWIPVTTGDVDTPAIVFDDGDVVMEEVPL